uniref:Sulfotransfer_1 domain-containing protein n=1 Tax=Panagrellus redivivus TaxID=6233 RepID=A0A7E4VVU1_PANRE
MPFPLASIPDPLFERLRQLTTPSELLRIQLAAPKIDKLGPLQYYWTTDASMQLHEDKNGLAIGQMMVHDWPPAKYPIHERQLYNIAGSLFILGTYFTGDTDFSVFNNWYLTPVCLKFSGCSMNLAGLKAFVKHFQGPIHDVQFIECSVAMEITLEKLFDIFPDATGLLMRYPMQQNWAQVLYDSTRRFQLLGIKPTVRQLDNLYKTDFLAYFKAQGPNFKLIFYFNEFEYYAHETEKAFKRLLGSSFERADDVQQAPFIEIKGYNSTWKYKPRYKVDRTVEIAPQSTRPARPNCFMRRCLTVIESCCCLQ